MLRTLFIALLIYSTALTAAAQSTGVPPPPTPQNKPHRAISDWPDPMPAEHLPQSTLDIFTLDKPTLRRQCHVHEIKADTVACRADHHRADVIYDRDNILTLIEPPAHKNLLGIVEFAGIVGGTLAASFFVPFAWCIALRALSGFFFLAGWAANGLAHDDLASLGYHDHNHDILLYQRPNTPLTITLR